MPMGSGHRHVGHYLPDPLIAAAVVILILFLGLAAILLTSGSLLGLLRSALWFARWRMDRLVYRLRNRWRDPSDHGSRTPRPVRRDD